MTEAALRTLLVDGFPLSTRRERLWKNLEWFVGELRRLRLNCRLWLDGSYLTEKIDPDDIDLIVELDYDFTNSLSAEQHAFLLGCCGSGLEGRTAQAPYVCNSFGPRWTSIPCEVETGRSGLDS